MKYVFAAIFGVLLLASAFTYAWQPDVSSPVPVLYWVTDGNPARKQQVDRFHEWLEANHKEELQQKFGIDRFELRIDTANADWRKSLIQGVSGIAGDTVDLYTHLGVPAYFHQIGMLANLNEDAERMGFEASTTYPGTAPALIEDGQQHSYPANVNVDLLIVNRDEFERVGLAIPKASEDNFGLLWDLDEFERLGKEYVERANERLDRQQHYFADAVPWETIARSLGASRFNETLTECTLDDPRFAWAMQKVYDWTHEDRILPTAADKSAFSVADVGLGGNVVELFRRGNYAMVSSGRYMLISLRNGYADKGGLTMSALPPPVPSRATLEELSERLVGPKARQMGDRPLPNARQLARVVVVYAETANRESKGVSHRELAPYFLSYLASEAYNQLIVDDSDALPPNPAFAQGERYTNPLPLQRQAGHSDAQHERVVAGYRGEWDVHWAFATAAREIAIGSVFSPFADPIETRNQERQMFEAVMQRVPPMEAAQRAKQAIEGTIVRRLEQEPWLRDDFEQAKRDQKEIERLRAAGERVPLELIRNPFLRRYYVAMGWSEPPTATAPALAPMEGGR